MHIGDLAISNNRNGNKSGALFYDLPRLAGYLFRYEVEGVENIQGSGPAIFIANHLAARGPIEIILSVPIRFYPWVIADMTDYARAPRYLLNDFVHPTLHFDGKLGLAFSTLLSKISIPLLCSLGAIPIDRFGGSVVDGFRQSLAALQQGKNLLIFPEDPLLPLDPRISLRPFMPGFASLCSMFQFRQGDVLPVYPIVVFPPAKLIKICKPEFLRPTTQHKHAINQFCQLLENRVRATYLNMLERSDDILAR